MVKKVPGKPYYECEFCHAHLDPGEECGCDQSIYLSGLQDIYDRMNQLGLIYGPALIKILRVAIEKGNKQSIYQNVQILVGIIYTLSELRSITNFETKAWRGTLENIQNKDLG
jgi:hypothetical protein